MDSAAAQAWLDRTVTRDDQRFRISSSCLAALLPRIRRTRASSFVPEARALEGLRPTLFEDIPAPVEQEETDGSAQAALFE